MLVVARRTRCTRSGTGRPRVPRSTDPRITLVGLFGTLVLRAAYVLVPHGHTPTLTTAATVLLCALAAAAALAATGIAHALVLSTPEPAAYFGWITGLATTAAVVLPFVTGDTLTTALAAAAIHLVIGLAIATLVSRSVAAATR